MSIGVPPVTPYLKALMIVCGAVWLVQVLLTYISFNLGGLSFEKISASSRSSWRAGWSGSP